MNPTDTSATIAQYAGMIAGALLVLAFLLQKFITSWKTDKTEGSILTLMHTELERMSDQNSKLSVELGKLQMDLITLNSQLRKLSDENQRLHAEVNMLTKEVARLQTILGKSV